MSGPRVRAAVLAGLAVAALLTACTGGPAPPGVASPPNLSAAPPAPGATDYTRYVDNDQGPGQVFMRYPLGRIGLWSTPQGEIADSVTRGLLLYPTVDQVGDKGTEDWRARITATPERTDITYRNDTPARGSAVALTVTPDVSIFQYRFAGADQYEAVDLLMQETENSNVSWSDSTFSYLDPTTAEVTLSTADQSQRAYFYVKFSAPAAGHGTFTQDHARPGQGTITGDAAGGYLTFRPGTPITVAVALSMTSMSTAEQNFRRQFPAFRFTAAVAGLRQAWNAKLGRIEVTSATSAAAEQVYTGLYTLYANIIDVTDNSENYRPTRPSTRLLTIGSSIWWERVGGGYFRCSFDQGRNVYAFLALLDPAVMRDVLNTYLSQYDRDGFLMGNWDPYDPAAWGGQQWGFFGYFFLAAKLEGITGVDYGRAERAILATMGKQATSRYLASEGYYKYGYVPADVGTDNYLSRGLEFATELAGLAHLAHAVGDTATFLAYAPYAMAYRATWNPVARVFQARNTDGSWAPSGAGLFEGTTATYAFDEPQDGPGLAALYGDSAMSAAIAGSYARPDAAYNDYQLTQPYLAIEADDPALAQRIIRDSFLPEFGQLTMWESPPGGGSAYYTDNASAVVLGDLGIYPIQSPGAQWILNSPAVVSAVIHGRRDTVIKAPGNTAATPYVRSVTVDGAPYPSLFISGETLAARDTTLAFAMATAPARIAPAYVTATTGEIRGAGNDGRGDLRFVTDPLGGTSQATVSVGAAPAAVTVNGAPLPPADWSYDRGGQVLMLRNLPAGTVLMRFSRLTAATPGPL
jgi:putative alpha-1,2-mannosidase